MYALIYQWLGKLSQRRAAGRFEDPQETQLSGLVGRWVSTDAKSLPTSQMHRLGVLSWGHGLSLF